ncbi:MAG TPA: hypothetical protein VJ400_03400 [Thermoplasmata archaeon]|nr:hypothetical protein [Thermoplasmata archaeon]
MGLAILGAGLLQSAWAYGVATRIGLSRRRWVPGLMALAILGFLLTMLGGSLEAQVLVFVLASVLYAAAVARRGKRLN